MNSEGCMSIAPILFVGILGFVIARIVACVANREPVPGALKLALTVAILVGGALVQSYLTGGLSTGEALHLAGSEEEGPWPLVLAGAAAIVSLVAGYGIYRLIPTQSSEQEDGLLLPSAHEETPSDRGVR